MTSLSRALTIRLSLLGLALFGTGVAAVLAFTFITEEPGSLRNNVTSAIIRQAVRLSDAKGVAVEKTPDLVNLQKVSPKLWYLISDGDAVAEYAPELRPHLPIDIRLDGPTIQAQMTLGRGVDNAVSFDVVQMNASRLIIATGGGNPSRALILEHYLDAIAIPALMTSLVFGIIIAAAIAMSVSFIGATLRRAAEAAAAIDPKAPRGSFPTKETPAELMPLTSALNSALDQIAGTMDLQRRFMNNVAHELRTPLSIMRSKVEGIGDAKTRIALTADVNRLTTIVSSMLQLARLHNADLPFEPIYLNHIARDALADLAPLLVARGIDIAFEEQGDMRPLINANEATVRAAVANLVDNAVFHAHARSTILLRVVDNVILEVVDDGIGITSLERRKVTEPFNRLSPRSDGAGLGLTIVRDIMAAHGGRLAIFETPGGGTTIRLFFAEDS
ncbi:sensor histidine kinase [Bradyrhizobium genosp. P]|uniref:sensor histidine kinase n=1 Tax=Bradyrhizobium genosp. P TaxID=83641 RepID=UPI003CF95B7D